LIYCYLKPERSGMQWVLRLNRQALQVGGAMIETHRFLP